MRIVKLSVGVDAGHIAIGDPCYVGPEVLDDAASGEHRVEGTTVSAVGPQGLVIVAPTLDGDGIFPVFATVNDAGQVIELRIVLAASAEGAD